MKKTFLTSFVRLEKQELQQLCAVVEETLATGVELPRATAKRKSYGINDLWSLRRNTKRSWKNRTIHFIVRG